MLKLWSLGYKIALIVVVCALLLLATANPGAAIRRYATAEVRPDSAAVQLAIIARARPDMGPREREMWRLAIADACTPHGIDPVLCTAKIAQESAFNQNAVSPVGARCAAQIMPIHYKNASEIKEIESCLKRGAEILAVEFKNCGTAERALRCYYAGPNNSKRGTLDRYGPYDLKAYSDGILARVYLAEQDARVGRNK